MLGRRSSACCAAACMRRATPSRRTHRRCAVSCCQMPPTYADVPSTAVTTTPIGSSSADGTGYRSDDFAQVLHIRSIGRELAESRFAEPVGAAQWGGSMGESEYLLTNADPTTVDRFGGLGACSTTCRSHISHAQLSARVAVAWRSVRVAARSRGGWPGRSERQGRVLTLDLDTRWFQHDGSPSSRRGTWTSSPTDSRGAVWDLIHERLVLVHIPARLDVLDKLVPRRSRPVAGSSSRITTRPRSARRIATDRSCAPRRHGASVQRAARGGARRTASSNTRRHLRPAASSTPVRADTSS